MRESERCPNVIANFWEWHRRHQDRAHAPIARLALDKCEETFKCSGIGSAIGLQSIAASVHTPKIPMLAMIGNGGDDGVCQCRALSVNWCRQ